VIGGQGAGLVAMPTRPGLLGLAQSLSVWLRSESARKSLRQGERIRILVLTGLITLIRLLHMNHLEDNTSGLVGVGQKLLAHSKVTEFTARHGLVVELFPFIVGASKRMSARAISRFLEKEQGVKLSSVTITRALNDPQKSWNLFFDTIEPSARLFAKGETAPMKDFLFREKYLLKLVKNPIVKAVAKILVPDDVAQAVAILRNKWYVIDLEIRLIARPYIEHRLK
jgi:hypothetical protein